MSDRSPYTPRRRWSQAVLRPALATSLLFAVVATLGVAEARAQPVPAQSFLVEASAPTRSAAALALGARAGRSCGFVRPDRGWHPQHRLSDLACTTRNGLAHCQARATCTPPESAQLAAR
jgi:hypothetical protein